MIGGLSALQTVSNHLMMQAAIRASEEENNDDSIVIEFRRKGDSKRWSLIEWLKSRKKS